MHTYMQFVYYYYYYEYDYDRDTLVLLSLLPGADVGGHL